MAAIGNSLMKSNEALNRCDAHSKTVRH